MAFIIFFDFPGSLTFIGNGLVVAGVLILFAALIPIRRLISQLPHEGVYWKWNILGSLIVLFIAGYIGYLVMFWRQIIFASDLVVPVVFFFGSCFVYLVGSLSLQTALDIRRLSDLEKENITDPLMNLYNRRYLDRRLEEEVNRARRYHFSLAVLLLDLDGLKGINDTYGHRAGDMVLSCVGTLIANSLRGSDIAARYGGDEIMIIAPGTADMEAAQLAERIRAKVEKSKIPLCSNDAQDQAANITISIGVACFSLKNNNLCALVTSADEALYQAKAEGRNRVMVWNPGLTASAKMAME